MHFFQVSEDTAHDAYLVTTAAAEDLHSQNKSPLFLQVASDIFVLQDCVPTEKSGKYHHLLMFINRLYWFTSPEMPHIWE
jgi:hypothetical protein